MTRRPPAPTDVDDLADVYFATLLSEISRFSQATQDRGDNYVAEQRVGELEVSPGRIAANVRGQLPYRTQWSLDVNGWRPSCSCPVGPRCKHAYALATRVLDALIGDTTALDDAKMALLFSGLTEAGVSASVAVTAPAPEVPAPPALQQLREGKPRRLRAEVLSRILAEANLDHVDSDDAAFRVLLDQSDPELLAWGLAQEILRWTKGELPAEFEPYRDRQDLAKRQAQAHLPLIEAEFRDWARQRVVRAERSLRLVMQLHPTPRGTTEFSLDARLSSARMLDEVRDPDQLRSLQAKVRRDPEMLTSTHSDLLDALVALFHPWGFNIRPAPRTALPRGHLSDFMHQVMPSPDVVWDQDIHKPTAQRWNVIPGGIVRFEPTPVRLIPRVGREGAKAQLELSAVWPDGRHKPLSEVIRVNDRDDLRNPTLGVVLANGVFYPVAEAPPPRLVELLESTPSLRFDRKQGEGLLRTLAEAMPSATNAATEFTHQHRVTPTVLLRLDGDDWLQVRILAHSEGVDWTPGSRIDEPARLFEFTQQERWEVVRPQLQSKRGNAGASLRIDAPDTAIVPARPEGVADREPAPADGPSLEDAWFHAPREDCVAAIVAWLASLGLARGEEAAPRGREPDATDLDVGWWIRVTARTVPVLDEAWRRRPAGVRWFGNDTMQDLLGPGRSIRPQVSAKQFKIDLLAVSAEWKAEGLQLTDADLGHLRNSKSPWVKLQSGWIRRDAFEVDDEVSELLADLGVEPGAGEQVLSLWQLAQARTESLDALERMGADAATIAAVRALRQQIADFKGLPRIKVPARLKGELRPYQRTGLDFLAYVSSLGMGSVLADDMGLGKTIQALAWLLHMRTKAKDPGPALVVCPASVVHNWEREAKQFAPKLRVLLLTSGSERAERMRELANYDLVVTNYALLRRDIDTWCEVPLFAAILDEAQHIKNPHAAVSAAVRELKAQHRMVLTGTPLENRALDLWSIMAFANPGYLGSMQDFIHRFDRANAPPHTRRLLAAKLRPVLLRRLKKEVAPELPERIEELRTCEMTPTQRKVYLVELARAREEVAALALRNVLKNHKIQILACLTRLRQICCHPMLVGAAPAVGSGKFEALFELLEPLLAEGHKVLLFSQFVKALELVKAEMQRRRMPFHMLTGSTTNRPQVVSAFESDPEASVFLISLRAGGTGLNLTAASYVVLLDPWWNPAVEAQAIDRTHRIGQNRTVIAYRLLMRDTIEEKIWELQRRKGDLVKSVLGEDGFARRLDREALEYLFAEK